MKIRQQASEPGPPGEDGMRCPSGPPGASGLPGTGWPYADDHRPRINPIRRLSWLQNLVAGDVVQQMTRDIYNLKFYIKELEHKQSAPQASTINTQLSEIIGAVADLSGKVDSHAFAKEVITILSEKYNETKEQLETLRSNTVELEIENAQLEQSKAKALADLTSAQNCIRSLEGHLRVMRVSHSVTQQTCPREEQQTR